MAGQIGRRGILTAVALAVGVSGCAIGGLLPSKDPDS
jgi:hypothetical protein